MTAQPIPIEPTSDQSKIGKRFGIGYTIQHHNDPICGQSKPASAEGLTAGFPLKACI